MPAIGDAGSDGGGVGEPLGLAVDLVEVGDATEADVPALVVLGLLGRCPERDRSGARMSDST